MILRITLALLAGLICSDSTNAQTVPWIATSAGGQGDVYASLENNYDTPGQPVLAVDAQGNSFLAGAVSNGRNLDVLVVKFSPSGERLWTASYGGVASTEDRALALAVDASGNVVVTGYTGANYQSADVLTLKLNGETGARIWAATYQGVSGQADIGEQIAVTEAGDVVVVAESSGANGRGDVVALKYAGSTGIPIWQTRDDGAPGNRQAVAALTLTADGSVVAAGYTTTATDLDFYSVCFSGTDGAKRWSRTYVGTGSGFSRVYGVADDHAGGVLVAGSSASAGGGSEMTVVRYELATGNESWVLRKSAGAGSTAAAFDVLVDQAGDFFVAGQLANAAAVVKFKGSDHQEIWSRAYDSPAQDRLYRLALDGSGHIFASGSGGDGYLYAKLDAMTGNLLWVQTRAEPSGATLALAMGVGNSLLIAGSNYYGGVAGDFVLLDVRQDTGATAWRVTEGDMTGLPESLRCEQSSFDAGRNSLITEDGDVVVAGCQEIGSTRQLSVTRFSRSGAIIWSQVFPQADAISTIPCCIAIDDSGDLIVGANSAGRVLALKLAGTTGTEIWHQFYDRGNGSTITSLTLDVSGDVLITGSGEGIGTITAIDYLTLKLRGGNGEMVWASHFDGSRSDNDGAVAIAASAEGDVAVTGVTVGATSSRDITTIRYDGSNGTPQWVQQRDGGANRDDRGVAVAFDPSGNVVVATTVAVAVAPTDMLTIKYSGTSGSEIWSQLYQGTGNAADDARSLAIDAAGDVYVAGNSSFSNQDATVLRIDGAAGQLLWAQRYDGGAGLNESLSAIQLDPLGRVFVAGEVRVGQNTDFLTLGLSAADGAVQFALATDFGDAGNDRARAIHQASDLSLRLVGAVRSPAGERIGVLRIEPDGVRLDGFEDSTIR